MGIVRAGKILGIAPARLASGTSLFATALCASIGASPAFAQDGEETPFEGFRVEIVTGWDNSGVNFDETFTDGRTSQNGFFYGAGVGYDFQFGGVVVGIEGEISDSTAGRDELLTGQTPNGRNFSVNTNIDAGGDYYIGLRGGAVVSRRLLIYLKGGYTHGTIDIDGGGTVGATAFTFDDGLGLDGIRIGLGGEYAFSPNFYGKAEYRYSNYNNGNFDINGNDVDLDAAFDQVDVDRHQFVLGAGFRF